MTQGPATVVVAARAHVAGERIEDASLEELIFDAASRAVASAGLTPAEVDGVVLSGNDQTDGRIISCMVTTGAAGGVGKNVTMVASAPEHAFAYACLRLLSGQGRNALVVGWSKPSESVHPEHAELVSADPFYVRPVGMNAAIAAALQGSALQASTPSGGVSGPASGGGGAGEGDTYVAWPLTRDSVHGHADGVCALVLERREAGDTRPGAVVRGVGWAMDRYELGDREDPGAGGLAAALALASRQAGPEYGPVDTLDTYAAGAPGEQHLADRLVAQLGDERTLVFSSRGEPSPDFAAGLFAIERAVVRVLQSAADGVGHAAAAACTLGLAGQGTTLVLLSTTAED